MGSDDYMIECSYQAPSRFVWQSRLKIAMLFLCRSRDGVADD